LPFPNEIVHRAAHALLAAAVLLIAESNAR